MNQNYDVAIIGAGLAGSFAALRLSRQYKNLKIIVLDSGRPPAKRRRQLEGWLGALPNSDGKFYETDTLRVAQICGNKKAKSAATWCRNYIGNIIDFNLIKDKNILVTAQKRLSHNSFEYQLNNYYQLYPKEIHLLSKQLATDLEDPSIKFSFDNEVFRIHKQKTSFVLTTQEGDFHAKNILISVGRSGWRWATEQFSRFGIIDHNDTATFGIHAELPTTYMKDFRRSNCTIMKEGLQIGPVSWNGTVIPEDHVDLAISAFRSNENRWKTDKVSFQIIGSRRFEGSGVEQNARLGKLAFLLSNDRVSRERVQTIMTKKSKISVIQEFDWLVDTCREIDLIIPNFINKGYFYVPMILPLAPKVKLEDDFTTEMNNLSVAGESAGIVGLMGAVVSGVVAADGIFK